jgi:hypothetical protein
VVLWRSACRSREVTAIVDATLEGLLSRAPAQPKAEKYPLSVLYRFPSSRQRSRLRPRAGGAEEGRDSLHRVSRELRTFDLLGLGRD